MPTAPRPCLTPEKYLGLDNQSEFRNEYVEGEVVAMARASKNHRRSVLNLTYRLREKLDGTECNAEGPECRVFIPARRVYVYPDVLVPCGEGVFAAE